jgi:hypothetical protein
MAQDGDVPNERTTKLLRNDMADFHQFIACAMAVLPRDS